MHLRRIHWAGIAALVIAIAALVIVLTGPSGPLHYRLGGPGEHSFELPKQAQAIATDQQQQDTAGNEQAAHSDLRQEPQQASSPAVLQQDQALKPPGQPTPPANIPLATVTQPGCRTLLVRNFSDRGGAPILLGVLHQTISPDAGWSGVLGNVKWFDTSAAQASSNYIVARSGGQCAYIVPETKKAWAQAGFNRVALSIEVTETGREGSYLPLGPGRQRIIQLMIAWHHRWALPYQHGIVNAASCTVVRPGFVEHKDLGSCGGGHFDDTPYSIEALIAAAAAKDHARPPVAIPARVKALCAQLNALRLKAKQSGWTRARRAAAASLKTKIGKPYTCTLRAGAARAH
jgi:hypothetical protein